MQYQELLDLLRSTGTDPGRLIFEDELTGISNRRFLKNYLKYKVPWNNLNQRVLSLIMTDLDGFKQLNDRFGHQFGDQALIWFANHLREVAGDENVAIRNSGDEFLILMPNGTKSDARLMAERILERFRQEPLRDAKGEVSLMLRLSIGVASAPDDAQDAETLIHKADTALYYAKNAGGNRLALADEVELEEVFARTALNQISGVQIAGRGPQLERVSEGLKRLGQRESQFLFVGGAAGMGKSTFLEAIRRRLKDGAPGQVIKVRGRQDELFRPYYLTTDILVALLNQRSDKGLAVFDDLSPEEIFYASRLLPQLAQGEEEEPTQDESLRRERIFNTFVHLISKALDSRPLILLIDDLHFIDGATLNLLRVLALREEVPLFLCGTFMDLLGAGTSQGMTPLQSFLGTQRETDKIEEIKLTPLKPKDISEHIHTLFPSVKMPKDFELELAQIVQGNPLFLGEILRKLVMDQKITLVGHQWTIKEVVIDELPLSLEEIVNEKIAALDDEGRQLLAHASVIGESVNLSALTGTSEGMEARILELLDQAVELGLLTSEFQLNDETIQFISKRVLEIIYGTIQEPRKQELHERVGSYQEELYRKKLMPSASILAYHFKRSAQREKARDYEQLQRSQNSYVFNASEAVDYAGDRPSEEAELGPPLTPASRVHLPGVLRWMLTGINNVKLYPSASTAIANATRELKRVMDEILAENEVLHLHRQEQQLMANGEPIDLVGCELVVTGVLDLLHRTELKGASFHRGCEERELRALMEAIGSTRPEDIDESFWLRFATENSTTCINLRQLRYTEVDRQDRGSGGGADGGRAAEARAAGAGPSFGPEERASVREVIRSLLGVARGIRLYPLKSKAVAGGIERLLSALQEILRIRRVLTLATAGEALLANGIRLGGSDVDRLARSFIGFLDSIKLGGLTFLEAISVGELESFIAAIREVPGQAKDGAFWKRLAAEKGISSIRFDENLYKVGELPTLVAAADEFREAPAEQEAEPDAEAVFADLLETLPERIAKLLLDGDAEESERLIEQLFHGLWRRDVPTRKRAAEAYGAALKGLSTGFRHEFARAMTEPLLNAFGREEHPDVAGEMATVLQRMAGISIQFSEYALACRILSRLHNAYRQFEAVEDPRAAVLAKLLDRKMESATQELLVEDLNSTDPVRQRAAARVLACVGRVAVPLLIDVVKSATGGRARQIAGSLLAEVEEEAGELLKRALVEETDVPQRVRILDVIDTVTRDVNDELARALVDENDDVRKAALRLAERLNDSQVVELLLEHARSQETELATSVIHWFGRLKAQGIVQEIISILDSTDEKERIIACCHALGQSGDPAVIQPLVGVLAARRRFRRQPKWGSPVRAAAAQALSKVNHEGALEELKKFAKDGDPAIRRIVRNASILPRVYIPPR